MFFITFLLLIRYTITFKKPSHYNLYLILNYNENNNYSLLIKATHSRLWYLVWYVEKFLFIKINVANLFYFFLLFLFKILFTLHSLFYFLLLLLLVIVILVGFVISLLLRSNGRQNASRLGCFWKEEVKPVNYLVKNGS